VSTSAVEPLGQLLAMLCSGDPVARERAWAACYEQYGRLVWTRVFFVVRTMPDEPDPRETTADIVSMVFLGLPSAARSYREQGKAEQWLKRVAIRTALRYKESRTGVWHSGESHEPGAARRRQVSLEDVVDEVSALLDEADRADLRLDFRVRLDAWRADPGKARWVKWVEMYCAGYAHEEIAQALGITPGVSRNWFKKITTALGTQPARQGVSEP
jgi:RNA polymerase sigma factor (sigma-70 family)